MRKRFLQLLAFLVLCVVPQRAGHAEVASHLERLAPSGDKAALTSSEKAGQGSPRASEGVKHKVVAVVSARAASEKVTQNLVLLAARVLATEDDRALRPRSDGSGSCGELTADHRGVLQVMDAVAAQKHWTRFATLGQMAPRVAGLRESSDRRHALFGSLPAKLEPLPHHRYAAPPLWEERDGPWDLYGPCWAVFLQNVRAALRDGYEPACDELAIAEGGPMDDHYALERGLRKLACGERLHFWAEPSKCSTISK